MSEPIQPAVSDLDALRAALAREAHTTDETDPTHLGEGLWLRDVVWATYIGPRTLQIAVAILASYRARRLLARSWTEECPRAEVFDAAVASQAATGEERDLADATRVLLTDLHTSTCEQCRRKLERLSAEVAGIEDPDMVLCRWTLTATYTTAMAGVRGTDHYRVGAESGTAGTVANYTLDDPGLYRALAASPLREPRYPSMRVQHDIATPRIDVQLTVPGGLAPTIEGIDVLLATISGQVRIPLDLSVRDDVQFTGTVILPTDTTPELDNIDIEVRTK